MTERLDLYGPVHKGIRSCMHTTTVSLGRMDVADAGDVQAALAGLGTMLVWLEKHLAIERDFVHPEVERRRPGALARLLDQDHEEHLRAIAVIRGDAESLAAATGSPPAARRASARHLYLAVARFVGENLVHMAREETEMNALLWELFDDDELGHILGAILAQETPEQLGWSVEWVLPSMSHEERSALLATARAAFPPPVFDSIVAQVASRLSEPDRQKLEMAFPAAA